MNSSVETAARSPGGRYIHSLWAQLEEAGPAALQMMRGDTSIDPLVLLAAVQAASLLQGKAPQDNGRGAALQALVLAAGPTSSALAEAVGALDLEPDAVDVGAEGSWASGADGGTDLDELASGDDLDERFHRLVVLAALLPWVPAAAAALLQPVVDRNLWLLMAHPLDFVTLTRQARFLDRTLALPEGHPAGELLGAAAVCEDASAMPLEVGQGSRVMELAERRLRLSPGSSLVAWLGDVALGLARWLEAQLALPVPATTATAGSHRPPPRYLVARDATGDEVTFAVHRGQVRLEWTGEGAAPESAQVVPGGGPLQRVSSVAGSAAWELVAPPDGGDGVRLSWHDRVWNIPLRGLKGP